MQGCDEFLLQLLLLRWRPLLLRSGVCTALNCSAKKAASRRLRLDRKGKLRRRGNWNWWGRLGVRGHPKRREAKLSATLRPEDEDGFAGGGPDRGAMSGRAGA